MEAEGGARLADGDVLLSYGDWTGGSRAVALVLVLVLVVGKWGISSISLAGLDGFARHIHARSLTL